jgi:hypothetical protein
VKLRSNFSRASYFLSINIADVHKMSIKRKLFMALFFAVLRAKGNMINTVYEAGR